MTAIRTSATFLLIVLLTGCAADTPVQKLTESTSKFGKNPTLMSNKIPANQMFRLFEQGATGWVTIGALRESVEQRAQQFCERQGKGTLILGEQKSNPPYLFGNFPRVEIVFACVDRPSGSRQAAGDEQYTKLSDLKKLLDEEAITRDEFEREKAKLLSR